MGNLVVVVGNTGSGKTTLTRLLCEELSYLPYWEHPTKRVFHKRFACDPKRWSLANQIDFLVFSAEQEWMIRQSTTNGVQDGGLDLVFHVFTRYMFETGRMGQDEYDLCHRTYTLIRQVLPPPDVVIRVSASLPVLARRRKGRGRLTDESIIGTDELAAFELLLDRWTQQIDKAPVLSVDSMDAFEFSPNMKSLASKIQGYFAGQDRQDK